MKTVNEYLELVERTLPDLKASDRLYVVGLLQDAYREGLDDMSRITFEDEVYDGYKGDMEEVAPRLFNDKE